MAHRRSGHTSDQRGGGRHGTDDGRGGGYRSRDGGAPEEVSGRRADHRAGKTQTVRVGILGRISTSRHDRDIPELRDRFRRR